MYRRFLNNEDYYSVITKESLNQLIRGNEERLSQAEQSAEMSIVEYLSENYEVEKELNKGKYIANYDRRISYPVGAFIYFEGKICEIIQSISGYKVPGTVAYWEEYGDVQALDNVSLYSQFGTYYKGDVAMYNGVVYVCLEDNGFKFDNVRLPMVNGWIEASFTNWQPINYDLWEVVWFEGAFYTLISVDGFDNNMNPFVSDCWGAIADYDRDFNGYALSATEYVVYNEKVFYPEMDVNADVPELGRNLSLCEPRNYNLKKHMVRLAVYELTKLVAPNNVSLTRVRDYEDSMRWLSDASKLKINPQIARKVAEDNKPVMDWQMATFQTDYDPYSNPWLV